MSKNKLFPLKIVLPGIVTPSLNQVSRWLQYEYYKIIQMKKDYWNMLLLAAAHEEQYKAKPEEKRIVHFYSYRPRKIDSDNLSGGMKYLRDQLEKMGLITDAENPRTEIVIYLIEEGE